MTDWISDIERRANASTIESWSEQEIFSLDDARFLLHAATDISKLIKALKIAEEVLKFYAEEYNHGAGQSIFKKSIIVKDFGKMADEALSEINKIGETE